MNHYITGNTIRELREKKKMTQAELAGRLDVSHKTISKWETAKGLPDISLIEPLARVLGISVVELMTGDCISNSNISSNMLRSKLYVCPVCGNVIHTMGESVVSCCGITLPVLEAEIPDKEHTFIAEVMDGEYYVTAEHEMTKTHFISFFAYVTSSHFELVKLYPEQNPEAWFSKKGHGILYAYCNRHGLMKMNL